LLRLSCIGSLGRASVKGPLLSLELPPTQTDKPISMRV